MFSLKTKNVEAERCKDAEEGFKKSFFYFCKNFVSCLIVFSVMHLSAEGEPLKVGMELSYPPFEMVNTQGQPSGISVELAYALGEYLKRPVVIENIPFVGLIPSLKAGKIDVVISSLSVTPARARSINFSKPYLMTGLCLLLSKDTKVSQIEDLDNAAMTVVVKQGTTGEVYARAHLTKAKVLALDKESSCVMEVVQGKANAFIYDQFSVFKQWQKHKGATHALLKPFYNEYWAMGLKKDNDALLEQVDKFLTKFNADRGMDKLADKYLPEQKSAFKQMGIPFLYEP